MNSALRATLPYRSNTFVVLQTMFWHFYWNARPADFILLKGEKITNVYLFIPDFLFYHREKPVYLSLTNWNTFTVFYILPCSEFHDYRDGGYFEHGSAIGDGKVSPKVRQMDSVRYCRIQNKVLLLFLWKIIFWNFWICLITYVFPLHMEYVYWQLSCFFFRAEELAHVMYRMGILSALRSMQKKGLTYSTSHYIASSSLYISFSSYYWCHDNRITQWWTW